MATKCPECGCEEFVNVNYLGEGYRCCQKCGQDWWVDIDYDQPYGEKGKENKK